MPFNITEEYARLYRAACPICGSCGPATASFAGARKLAELWGWNTESGTCIVCAKMIEAIPVAKAAEAAAGPTRKRKKK